ncbi:MAG: glycerol-3-phosphate 1-O-acyltransferase PlsY [Candidatus Omnitrophota bacterium]
MDLGAVWLLAGGYLLGSIPVGYLVGRLFGVDIRRQGSGNIGATNVLRTIGKGPAVATLILDIGKGFLPVILARRFFPLTPGWTIAVGLTAVIGHTFSIFLRFKGGKGVATGFGVLTGFSPLTALYIFGIWLVVFAVSRIVSLASLSAAVALPILIWHLTGQEVAYLGFGCLVTFLVFVTHRTNIRRLLSGKEPKIQWKR